MVPIDNQTERATKAEALRLRRARMDKPASVVSEYAAKVARREMLAHLMTSNRSAV